MAKQMLGEPTSFASNSSLRRNLTVCGRRTRWLGLALSLLLFSSAAWAEPVEQVPLGLAQIAERTERDTPMRFEQRAYRTFVLDRLRSLGIQAVGGDDDVFGRNDRRAPDLLLGGVVSEYECAPWGNRLNCRIGLKWQLLDVRSEQVIYETLVRVVEYGIQASTPSANVGRDLLAKALQSLLRRPRFRDLLVRPQSAVPDRTFPASNMKRCALGSVDLQRDPTRALDATVSVETSVRSSVGLFLNDEGFILTTAQVESAPEGVMVRLRDGRRLEATVLRVSRGTDSALLQVRGNLRSSCVELAEGEAKLGAEVYALSALGSAEPPFALTRGIVSGLLKGNSGTLLQTDAALAPRNGGGALLGVDGRLRALMSWRIVRAADELAVGVPTFAILRALGLNVASGSDAQLGEVLASPTSSGGVAPIVDTADAMPSLDPPGDDHSVRQTRASEVQRALVEVEELPGLPAPKREPTTASNLPEAPVTPGYIKVLRWGGLALAGAGLATAVVATTSGSEPLQPWRDVGLVGAALGGGSFGVSWLIPPRVPAGPGELGQPRKGASVFVSFRARY